MNHFFRLAFICWNVFVLSASAAELKSSDVLRPGVDCYYSGVFTSVDHITIAKKELTPFPMDVGTFEIHKVLGSRTDFCNLPKMKLDVLFPSEGSPYTDNPNPKTGTKDIDSGIPVSQLCLRPKMGHAYKIELSFRVGFVPFNCASWLTEDLSAKPKD